jgi:hypothetical protein
MGSACKAVGRLMSLKKSITLEDVERHRRESPKRCRFLDHNVIRERPDETYIVSTKFHSVTQMFEAETGITTREGPYGPYAYLSDKDQIEAALTWQESRCALIFLRDALDCSLALDLNLREPGVYTDIGLAEHNAKVNGNQEAITYLAGKCFSIISALGLYKDCTAVCAVPPSPNKTWDLPTEIVRQVATKSQKANIWSMVRFQKIKQRIKSAALSDRWGALDAAESEGNKAVSGHRVIVIDDKYQSGTTIQFVASKLFHAGTAEVLGLSCVKTWRDTDNT